MPIEFSCTGCGNTLRVPDTAAGKKAQCPTCEAVLEVPFASNPFAESSAPGDQSENQNPYASPLASTPLPGTDFAVGELSHCRISFSVFETAWLFFKQQLGMCVLFGLIILGMSLLAGVVSLPLNLLRGVNVSLALLSFVLNYVWGLLINVFVSCLMVRFALALMRNHPTPLSDMFKIGPYFLKVLCIYAPIYLVSALCGEAYNMFMLGVINEGQVVVAFVLGGVGLLAVFIVGVFIYLSPFFIIDRQAGILEGLSLSIQFMKGNKMLTAVIIVLEVFGSFLGVCFTCGVGTLFVIPYFALVNAAIYLVATGQIPTQLEPD